MQSVNINSPLIRRSRNEAVQMASTMIERCAEVALASLDEAQRRSGSVALRLQLGEAFSGLMRQRLTMRSAYPIKVDDAIGKALFTASTQTISPNAKTAEDNGHEFSLIEDDAVSRFVEASRLQQIAMPVVDQELAQLDSLISSALGLPVVRSDLNPLRPDVLCGALLQLIEEMPDPPEVRAHWIRHMAHTFARELKRLYAQVVKMLQEQGIEEARYRLKLTEGGAPPPKKTEGNGNGNNKGNGEGEKKQDPNAMPDDASQIAKRRSLFPKMDDLAKSQPAVSQALMRDFLYQPKWLAENDEPLPPAYYQAVQEQIARVAHTQTAQYDPAIYQMQMQQMRAISAIDRPARQIDVMTALPPEQWGEQASPAARIQTMMELKSQATKISQALGLDAVRTLVTQVANDERVLAPVREAFVAMEPALLRMAMTDPQFFGDDNHPARRLVESVAQRSLKYNDEFAEEFEDFIKPVRQIVRELNEKPKASVKAFDDNLQKLQQDWQAEDSGEKVAQDEGLRGLHFAQERQALADKIAWEFSLRSDLERVPVIVADFLYQNWSLVIAHAQLTDNRGQLDPGGYLAVVSDLLWSVKREETLKNPTKLFEIVPYLLKTLRKGLEMLGKEPADTEEFFDALMRYHAPVLRLRRVRSAHDAEVSGFARLETDSAMARLEAEDIFKDTGKDIIPTERPQPKAAEKPWLGRGEIEAAGFEDVDSDTIPLITNLAPLEELPQVEYQSESQEDSTFPETIPTSYQELHYESPEQFAKTQPLFDEQDKREFEAKYGAPPAPQQNKTNTRTPTQAARFDTHPAHPHAHIHPPAQKPRETEPNSGYINSQQSLQSQQPDSGHSQQTFSHSTIGSLESEQAAQEAIKAKEALKQNVKASLKAAAPTKIEPTQADKEHLKMSPEAMEAHIQATLERLRKGDWVDLKVRGKWRRAQLNWTSNTGALFMFVSRGGRPHSMTRRTCEKLIKARHLRPVDRTAVVDKALQKMQQGDSKQQNSQQHAESSFLSSFLTSRLH